MEATIPLIPRKTDHTPNVLIIEDDLGTLETLPDILQEDGLNIVCARNGMRGLDHLKKESFQVVLLDLKLPDRNGLDILKEIIESDSGQRVIVITGYSSLETAIKALNQGAYSYITKPFNLDELRALIKQAVAQSELAAKKREADQEIGKLKEYNESILASLPFAVAIFDQSLKIEYVNSVYLKDFGLRKEDAIGRDLFEILPLTSSDKKKVKDDVVNFLSEITVEPQEINIARRVFGYRFFCVLKGTLQTQKTGLIIRDITIEKKMQQQLVQSEKLAGIGTMSMGIAHEINNPLFGIMGMAEAILDEKDPGLIKEYSKDIIRYSKNAAAIVRGLTIYSRSTEAGNLSLINVNERLDEAIKIVSHAIQFDGIELIKDYQSNKDIRINSGELQQIFVNIIHNAAQAINGKGRIHLSTRIDQGRAVVIKIADSGPGIPKENIGRIFDPFFTTKDPDQGTGLGLNIVYRIVEKYNGSIGVESEEGEGTTFTMTFPTGE